MLWRVGIPVVRTERKHVWTMCSVCIYQWDVTSHNHSDSIWWCDYRASRFEINSFQPGWSPWQVNIWPSNSNIIHFIQVKLLKLKAKWRNWDCTVVAVKFDKIKLIFTMYFQPQCTINSLNRPHYFYFSKYKNEQCSRKSGGRLILGFFKTCLVNF